MTRPFGTFNGFVLRVTLFLFLVVVTACGSSDSHGPEAGSTPETPPIRPIQLEPSQETDLTGTARLNPTDDALEITLRLDQLEPGTRYNAHLHRGTCEEGVGGGVNLEAVTGQPDHSGSSHSRVEWDELNPSFNHAIMVHLPTHHHALCGDIPPLASLRKNE